MTIEQHAEAAAEKIAILEGWSNDASLAEVVAIIQAAIDESIAEKMIGVLDNASNHVHEVDLLKARIAELEELGPLIEEILNFAGDVAAMPIDEGIEQYRQKAAAILKGGAS